MITVDGTTFERCAIEEHFRQQRLLGVIFLTDPITDTVIINTELIPNLAVKFAIDYWKQHFSPNMVTKNPEKSLMNYSMDNPLTKTRVGNTHVLFVDPVVDDDLRKLDSDNGSPPTAFGTTMIRIPTLAIGVLSTNRDKLCSEYNIEMDIESDDDPQHVGTRQVILRSLDPSVDVPLQAEFCIWSWIQKHCSAKSISFDAENGQPFTQLLFPIPATSQKIGYLLHIKKSIQTKFKVHFLVEKRRNEKDERMVILTAWNSNHNKVQSALELTRDFILSKME